MRGAPLQEKTKDETGNSQVKWTKMSLREYIHVNHQATLKLFHIRICKHCMTSEHTRCKTEPNTQEVSIYNTQEVSDPNAIKAQKTEQFSHFFPDSQYSFALSL